MATQIEQTDKEVDIIMEKSILDALRVGECKPVVSGGRVVFIFEFSVDMEQLKSTLIAKAADIAKESVR